MSKDKSRKPQEPVAAGKPQGLNYASLDTKYIARITGVLLRSEERRVGKECRL